MPPLVPRIGTGDFHRLFTPRSRLIPQEPCSIIQTGRCDTSERTSLARVDAGSRQPRFCSSVRLLGRAVVSCDASGSAVLAQRRRPRQTPETFIQQARRALAQGRPAEAEALARPARPAIPRRRPCSRASSRRAAGTTRRCDCSRRAPRRNPSGEAALELGLLLQQQFGRADVAAEHLNRVLGRGLQAPDSEAVFRAARAAQALGRMQDANALFRAAARSGRSRGRNRVGRAVPRDRQSGRSAEVVSAGAQGRRRLGAGAPRRRAHARGREPAGGRGRGRRGAQDRRRARRRAPVPRRARARQHALRRRARADRPRARRPTRRISTRARCSAPSPTSATTRRRSTPRWRASSPSTRPSARSIASPAISPRATIASTRRSR